MESEQETDVQAPFNEWNGEAPFDLDREISRVPDTASVKGLIIKSITDQLRLSGHPTEKSTLFADYPMHDYMRLCVEAATILWPQETIREGLRRVGHGHYSAFTKTPIGRVVFGVLGRNMGAVIRQSPKGYKYTTNCSAVRVLRVEANEALIELGGLPFADTLQVGVYEGGVRATGFVPQVTTRRTMADIVQICVQWSDGGPSDA